MRPLLPLAALSLALASVGLGMGGALAQTTPDSARAEAIRNPGGGTSSRWGQLPPAQQAALQPLASEWDGLSDAHRRKWLALARNFGRMSAEEQGTLHSRMTQWATLSPRERSRARLNFAEVQRLAPVDKRKAQWDAYRALTEDERKALAQRATATPRGSAIPPRPVPESRLAPIPPNALSPGPGGPRIALTPPARPALSDEPAAAADSGPVLPTGAQAPASLDESTLPDMATSLRPAAP